MKGYAEEMDSSKVIKASAGTGKTYTLSIEILALLLKGVPIKEVLAVTFTKKATAEIRERVLRQLDELIAFLDNKQNDAKYLYEALKNKGCELSVEKVIKTKEALLINKSDFRVMTLDAFIHSIFSTLIAPYLHIEDFVVINSDINEECINETLELIFTDSNKKKKLVKLISLNKKMKNLSNYKAFIEIAISKRFVLEKIPLSEETVQPCFSSLKRIIDSIFDLITSEKGSSFEYINNNVFKEYKPSIGLDTFKKMVLDDYKGILKMTNFWSKIKLKSIQEDLNDSFIEFKQGLADIIFKLRIVELTANLKEMLAVVFSEYDSLKFRKKMFTHQDISYYTYKYLYNADNSLIDLDRGDVQNIFYELLSSRISYLLIDEFQDTSVLQWNILFPLIREISSGGYGGVICVGDDKQAIYGWREGERELLNSLLSIMNLPTEKMLFLNKSYRSSMSVISFINSFFSKVSSLIDWDYREVECNKKEEEGYVELHLNKNDKKEHNLEDEVELLVSRFHDLITKNLITAQDSVMLFRTNKEMEMAGVALKKRGIPFVLESASSIFDHKAIKPVIYLLEYIVSKEVLRIFDFIRSDYMGYSLQQISELLKDFKDTNYQYDDILEIKNIVDFLDNLDLEIPIEQVIIKILTKFNASTVFTQVHDQKNIRKFIEIVRDMRITLRDRLSLSELLQEFNKKRTSEDFRQVGLESSDSVQLMTIHKSKGMEFNNVFFMWNLTSSGSGKGSNYLVLSEYNDTFNQIEEGFILFPEDEIVIENHKTKSHLHKNNKKKEFQEIINNLYVALTRAKQKLFVFCLVGKKYEDIDKLVTLTGEKTNDLYLLMKEALIDVCNEHGRQLGSIAELEEKPLVIGSLVELTSIQFPFAECCYSNVSRHGNHSVRLIPGVSTIKKFVTSNHHVDNKIVHAKDLYINKQLEGSIIHEYLSCIYENDESEHVSAKRVLYQKYGAFYNKQEIEHICQKCKNFIINHSDIFYVGAKAFNEHIVFDNNSEYRVDRIMLDDTNKTITIIDYKTGREKDSLQLENYKRIVKSITKGEYQIETKFLSM